MWYQSTGSALEPVKCTLFLSKLQKIYIQFNRTLTYYQHFVLHTSEFYNKLQELSWPVQLRTSTNLKTLNRYHRPRNRQ